MVPWDTAIRFHHLHVQKFSVRKFKEGSQSYTACKGHESIQSLIFRFQHSLSFNLPKMIFYIKQSKPIKPYSLILSITINGGGESLDIHLAVLSPIVLIYIGSSYPFEIPTVQTIATLATFSSVSPMTPHCSSRHCIAFSSPSLFRVLSSRQNCC